MVSTVWFACAREHRGYLWGGLRVGVCTLDGESWGGLGGQLGVTAGGTLRGAWGSVVYYGLGSYTGARVCLVGG